MTDRRDSGTATGPQSPSQVDELVRGTLRDDLPAEIEARLDRGLERFVAERARGRHGFLASPLEHLRDAAARASESALGRALLPVASSLLLASGLALLAAGHRSAFAESFSRVNLAVSLSEAIRRASSMACVGWVGEEFASRDGLADGVYRRLTFLGVENEPEDGSRLVFGSGGGTVRFEFVVEGGSLLPREIRRVDRPGAAPEAATCVWGGPRQDAGGLRPRSEP